MDKPLEAVRYIFVNHPLCFCYSNFLFRYYVNPPTTVVLGTPSATLAEKLERDEKDRIAKQVAELDPEGLERARVALEAAKAEHGRLFHKTY